MERALLVGPVASSLVLVWVLAEGPLFHTSVSKVPSLARPRGTDSHGALPADVTAKDDVTPKDSAIVVHFSIGDGVRDDGGGHGELHRGGVHDAGPARCRWDFARVQSDALKAGVDFAKHAAGARRCGMSQVQQPQSLLSRETPISNPPGVPGRAHGVPYVSYVC